MVLLCFVLDLCNLSPPLVRDLKQCLLQLANFYAISSPSRHQSESIVDKIGLCYLFKNRSSSSVEVKIVYTPRGNFSLRDFHHAVNNLPNDAFSPEIEDSGSLRAPDVKLSFILSDQALYSWGGKDIMRKVIVLSSSVPNHIDSNLKNTLADAADKCVSVEFVLFEQSSSHLINMQENVNRFGQSLSDLDNCSVCTHISGGRVFHGLVKKWLQDLKDDMEEPLQARFIFKSGIIGAWNQMCCSLTASVGQIVDGFSSCKTCRCHGSVLDSGAKGKVDGLSCPVLGSDLGASDVMENSVKIGDRTVLFMPSFQSSMDLQHVSSPIDFNIIERTNLGSLSEGVIIGSSYFVTPSACYDETETSLDEFDQPERNFQIFQGICNALQSMDQALVCSSYCNVQTMRQGDLHCYYILQPSENGPMLLRCMQRLAGSEEVLPLPELSRLADASITKEVLDSIQASLLKVELRDYDPILHERGFHQMLNLLIKESLQFGSIPPKLNEEKSESNLNQLDSSDLIAKDVVFVEDESPRLDMTAREDKTSMSIAEEWEQLVVNDVPKIYSPTCVSKPNMDFILISPPDANKQLDAKTSRILERLEVPRQIKTKRVSPNVTSCGITEAGLPTKKPLIPFHPSQTTDQTSSQLMKPNFQRLKRKHIKKGSHQSYFCWTDG